VLCYTFYVVCCSCYLRSSGFGFGMCGFTSTEVLAPANSSSSSLRVFSLSLTWSTESCRTMMRSGGFSTETIFRINRAVCISCSQMGITCSAEIGLSSVI
jgi:hypothetical protein